MERRDETPAAETAPSLTVRFTPAQRARLEVLPGWQWGERNPADFIVSLLEEAHRRHHAQSRHRDVLLALLEQVPAVHRLEVRALHALAEGRALVEYARPEAGPECYCRTPYGQYLCEGDGACAGTPKGPPESCPDGECDWQPTGEQQDRKCTKCGFVVPF